MNTPPNLRVIEENAASPETGAEEPKIFVRTLSAPAGLPWDQARAAALEARLGAPLPLGEVVYQLKRLEPWSPGKPARFAAFYVRAQSIGERLSARPHVDGEPVVVEFLSRAERQRRSKQFLIQVTAAGAAAAVLLGAAFTVLSVRSEASAELAAAEQLATAKLSQAKAIQRLKDQTRTLNGMGLRDRSLDAVLRDLAWASSAKAPDVHVLSVRWEHGLMAFEVKGGATPFTLADRPIRKADGPANSGVTLWGVGPASVNGGMRTDDQRPSRAAQ